MLPPPPPYCFAWCSQLHLILYKIIPKCLRSVVLEKHTSFLKDTALFICRHFLSRKFSFNLCVSWQIRSMWVALWWPWHKGHVQPSTAHPPPTTLNPQDLQCSNPHPKPSWLTPFIPLQYTTYFSLHPPTLILW